MARRKKIDEVQDLEGFTDMPSGLEETNQPEPEPEPHPYEGYHVLGRWRGGAWEWFKIVDGKLRHYDSAWDLPSDRKVVDLHDLGQDELDGLERE